MARPSPRPPCARSSACGPCTKRSKTRGSISAAMPIAGVAHAQHRPSSPSRVADDRDASARAACTWRRWSAGSRPPAPAAPGRRRPAVPLRGTSTLQRVRALLEQRARHLDRLRDDVGELDDAPSCSSTLPRVIRDTSSRSSTSRIRCATWRSMTVRSRSSCASPRSFISCSAVRIGDERVAQLVTEHRQELVLGAVGGLGGLEQLGTLALDARALDRLPAAARDLPHQLDFVLRPARGSVRVHGHRRHEPAVLQDRHADHARIAVSSKAAAPASSSMRRSCSLSWTT